MHESQMMDKKVSSAHVNGSLSVGEHLSVNGILFALFRHSSVQRKQFVEVSRHLC